MMVMPANWSSGEVHFWAGRYPGSVGHLYSPGGFQTPRPWLPYALDNGAWGAFLHDITWDPCLWRNHLRRSALSGQAPLWVVVPDVVGNRDETLARWREYAPEVAAYGFPLAFAAQDGMVFSDVPGDADVIFLGGSTEWKLDAIRPWCARFPGRVHVARVNEYQRLRLCADAGAISCDGSGWGRGDKRQLAGLYRFIEEEWDNEDKAVGAAGIRRSA